MNYFAHGWRFIDDPYFLAGTALPDWLNVVDRKLRVRAKRAREFVDSPDPVVARLARGIVQHHADDDWFHGTPAFAELSLEFARRVRDALPVDDGFRPHFLGHILVEILLDAELIAEHPDALVTYYAAMDSLDGQRIAAAVAAIAPRPAENLATFVGLFSRERFLFDYADDAKLLFRLNQVMRRVGLPVLPAGFSHVLHTLRPIIRWRKLELFDPKPSNSPSGETP
jgi:hypothetical protein